MLDGELLTRPTLDAIRAGVGADKPLLLGSVDDEFTMITDRARHVLGAIPPGLALGMLGVSATRRRAYLAANRAQVRKGTAAVVGRYVTDSIFRSTVVKVADARGTAPTWVYRFAWASPTRRWALHCLDVPFWFDCVDADGVTAIAGNAPPQALADATHGAAVAFVLDDDPGWKPWSDAAGTTRVFGGPGPDVIPDGYAEVRALVT